MKITQTNLRRLVVEEYYIHLIEQELRARVLTEVQYQHLYPRDSAEAARAFHTAQRYPRSKEARARGFVTSTDSEELKRAEEEGLGALVYLMSNPARQNRYDRAGGLAAAREADLIAADKLATDQARVPSKVPATTEPRPPLPKISASDQPASTSGQLDWFLNRWKDFSKSASPEEFRAEVHRSMEYLPDGQNILQYLQKFLNMLRNRYEHEYQTV